MDWNSREWLYVARDYYLRQPPEWQTGQPGTICRDIVNIHMVYLDELKEVDWFASRIHDFFIIERVYKDPTMIVRDFERYIRARKVPWTFERFNDKTLTDLDNLERGARRRQQRAAGPAARLAERVAIAGAAGASDASTLQTPTQSGASSSSRLSPVAPSFEMKPK